ncbi:unnamed protein product [Cylindrotheca closterium]|uniref:PiggyBac transposable element-derived protein domain-containing protein n=1 Tax=Cylindrotheca closterium TaxID=2856 RepID=A0AAD2FV69_9STRA|nr:unnamed protein product [Cylindrotheca closterium]
MPKNIDYFLDPVKLIKHYKSCRLNQSKSKVNGYGLAEVWCFVTEKTKLEGAHNSLVDTFAQCEILHDDRLLPFLDKPAGIELMEDILEPKRKARQLLMDETKRDLPIGWVDRCDEYFTVNGQKRTSSEVQQIALNSSAGGGRRGPNMGMWNLLRQESLVDLFLNFFKKTFLQIIARETNRYGNEDWVKLTSTGGYFNFAQEGVVEDLGDEEEDTEPRSKPKRAFVPCNKDDPDRRKRHSGSKWKDVTPGLLLICFGSTPVKGATKIRKINLLWGEKWQTGIPYVQNSCTMAAFNQVRRNLHFVETSKLPKKGDRKWSPLQKIQPVLDYLQKQLSSCYNLGDRISIDESMIKYCGKYISWIQYMPKKPIKHGIKVYALCCAYTGYLYSFEIYTGKEGTESGTPREVIGRLLRMAGILPSPAGAAKMTGTVLYTDNWYTSLDVMQFVYEQFGMLLVGTISLTAKKSRTADDYPFHKYKNTLLRRIPRGWTRLAYQTVRKTAKTAATTAKAAAGKVLYLVQATLWKDKKMVGFLHNHLVQSEQDHQVKRWDKESRTKKEIPAHPIVTDYNKYMGGVDAKDRDTADWSVSLKSNHWYYRIFYWIFDSVIHAMWVLVKTRLERMTKEDLNRSKWKSFANKDTGRFEFQMTLGILLMKRGLEWDWKGDFKDPKGRPEYCRKTQWIPCECPENGVQCFFCYYGHTNGIEHQKAGVRKREYKRNFEVRTHVCDRVDLGRNPQYCNPCYHSLKKKYLGMTSRKRYLHPECKKTRLGCPGCNRGNGQHVCKSCWKTYKHDDER